MRYFVMLNHPVGRPTPLIDSDNNEDWPAIYDTEEEAETDASQNPLGEYYGYIIYEWEY